MDLAINDFFCNIIPQSESHMKNSLNLQLYNKLTKTERKPRERDKKKNCQALFLLKCAVQVPKHTLTDKLGLTTGLLRTWGGLSSNWLIDSYCLAGWQGCPRLMSSEHTELAAPLPLSTSLFCFVSLLSRWRSPPPTSTLHQLPDSPGTSAPLSAFWLSPLSSLPPPATSNTSLFSVRKIHL